jgi:hypothetical protein
MEFQLKLQPGADLSNMNMINVRAEHVDFYSGP